MFILQLMFFLGTFWFVLNLWVSAGGDTIPLEIMGVFLVKMMEWGLEKSIIKI